MILPLCLTVVLAVLVANADALCTFIIFIEIRLNRHLTEHHNYIITTNDKSRKKARSALEVFYYAVSFVNMYVGSFSTFLSTSPKVYYSHKTYFEEQNNLSLHSFTSFRLTKKLAIFFSSFKRFFLTFVVMIGCTIVKC